MLRSLKTVKQVILPAALLLSNLANAQFRTVTVQNANDNPVPTTIQNTPQVTVTGPVNLTGPVDANIVNTPNVNVANIPTVNVSGTVPVTGAINAAITNVPTVNVSGTVPVTGAINAAITNIPTVNVSGTLPISGAVNAAITNVPHVTVEGTTTISGAVNAAITNIPTVNVSGTLPITGAVNAAITNVPHVTVDGTTAISGAVNAAITNIPTVNVSGIVPVTVSGTPAVTVANLPLGVAGPQSTSVVLVKSVDGSLTALQPLQIPFSCTTGQNGICTSSFNIPQGKVFVAEYMQATAQEPPAINTLFYRLQTTSGGQTMTYTYEPGAQIIGQGMKMRTSEHLVKIYADAGSTISFSGFSDLPGGGNGNTGVSVNIIVSGQLVNTQ